MSPMQQQYIDLKKQYPDSMLLFRLGDFYEVFDEDAIKASQILGITLTGRGKGDTRKAMAGIPYHALANYLPKLISAGVKVAIAEQTEEAVPGKLVERKITKVITAGTITDENSLDEAKNNFIGSIYIEELKDSHKFYFVYTDLTTGTFKGIKTENASILKNFLQKLEPAEVLVSEKHAKNLSLLFKGHLEIQNESKYDPKYNLSSIKKIFGVSTLSGFGIDDNDLIIMPAGVLLDFLQDTQKSPIHHIKRLELIRYSDYMQLDESTIRNLELLQPMQSSGSYSATLVGILDDCKTPMGRRMLRSFIINPLINNEMLIDRIESVDYFFTEPILIDEIRNLLKEVYDTERIAGKIGLQSVNPKDLVTLKNSFVEIYKIVEKLKEDELPKRIQFLLNDIDIEALKELSKFIHNAIADEPSVFINEGGIFREGYNSEIDELRNIRKNAKQILLEMQEKEIKDTNIPSLKISFNKVFGYYIEITRTHLDKVPDRFIRKQTLANAERYITEELKELEEKILSSEEKLVELEKNLYIEFRAALIQYIDFIKNASDRIAEIDVVVNFANRARQFRFTKPEIIDKPQHMLIEGGRHPVVERLIEKFTPNSTEFGGDAFIHILTGPNMSGKSTYIRQVALITLMAQIGSFVPANKFQFAPCDRIFTRVGASDNLARGESTFMVEMIETANILNNASEYSLIILDEIGRGTSTYDGVAIAWSIIEHLQSKVKARTLFATHYHELIELENSFKGIKNFNVAVDEDGGEIKFAHRIIPGGTNRSYGVHVAKIAGVPADVVKRANEILISFENRDSDKEEISKNQEPISKQKSNGQGNAPSSGLKARGPVKPKNIHPEQLGLL